MLRRRTAVVIATLALAAVPSFAEAGAVPAQTEGTWTFIDFSPDPTSTPEDATMHCHGMLPTAPGDVNSQPLKLKSAGTLNLTSHNVLDWAMELRDSGGNVVTGTDGGDLTTPENLSVFLPKGKYEVVYCNLEGEPEITVDYSFEKA